MALSPKTKKWATFVLRWGVAVFGIAYVISNLTLRDRGMIQRADGTPVEVTLESRAPGEGEATWNVVNAGEGLPTVVRAEDLLSKPDVTHLQLLGGSRVNVLAVSLREDLKGPARPDFLLVSDPAQPGVRWVAPEQVEGGYSVRVPYPKVDIGLIRMVRQANPVYLWGAVALFPITYLVTSLRWWLLMRALEITVSPARAFTLNMVGAFYNTFMPGSTGGDVLKAYYAAKQTTQFRTRAVMSVIIDRVIGLLALIILGGTMAAYQWEIPIARKVAVVSGVVVALTGFGLIVFYSNFLRRVTGLDLILRKLPMQKQVSKAVEAMDIYRKRPLLPVAALLMTFPVHSTGVITSMLCGMAFGLPLAPIYYFVCVPVIVLVGSIPISPQGAGVMEFFAIHLTKAQGVTIGQAFALTMSIRILGMLWNLTGGLFVLRGGYHSPTDSEAKSVDAELAPQGTAIASEV